VKIQRIREANPRKRETSKELAAQADDCSAVCGRKAETADRSGAENDGRKDSKSGTLKKAHPCKDARTVA